MKNLLTGALSVLLLAGCVASGERFARPVLEEGIDGGLVYVYRPFSIVGSAGSPKIYVDDVYRGKLRTGGFAQFELAPGTHTIFLGSKPGDFANWSPSPVIFVADVDAGDVYYYKLLIDNSSVSIGVMPVGSGAGVYASGAARVGVKQIPEAVALEELANARRSSK